jgi:type IV pilus biogenesis/stability protein PilW
MNLCRVSVLALLCLSLASAGCGGGAGVKKPASQDPDSAVAQAVRTAESYYTAGRVSEALAFLEAAMEAAPARADLRNYYGQMSFVAGRLEQAETALRRALELDPYLADAHNNLGAVLDRIGRKDEAEAEFRKALEDPTYTTPEKARLNIGLLYASQGRDDEAILELRRAVEANPKFYRGHFELASLLDKTGRAEEAVRIYGVAAPQYKNDGEYHYRLGFLYFRMNQPEQARAHLMRVLDVAPGSENAAKAGDLLKLIR